MMPSSHAATTYPPRRGLTSTVAPATISTTPTPYMMWWGEPGTRLLTHGARYLSQLVSQSANLSAPKRIGATVNAIRSSQKAWYVGSVFRRSPREAVMAAGPAAVLIVMALPRFLTETKIDVRTMRF